MQEPFENDETHTGDQRTENEIKKIKLALEHGMDISQSFSSPPLPPDVEGAFLDYIQRFEVEFAKRKTIVLYDFVGTPEWKPVAEISDEDISSELDRIMKILEKHAVSLDTLCDVEEREIYRFVTEELFVHEMDDMRIPGMRHCFTYEEFHPNHEYDIKNRCTELVEHITNKEKGDTEPWGLAENISFGESSITKEELNMKLVDFRDSFSAFSVQRFEYTTVNINEDKTEAEALADIHYSAIIDGSNDALEFKGQCRFLLKCEYEWWTIYSFEMPGLTVG